MFGFISPVSAMAAPNGAQGGGGSMISTLIFFGAIMLIFYFLIIRPNQKRQKEMQQMLNSIKKGDKVVTTAGIHGSVVEIDDKTVVLQVADNVKMRFERSAVAMKKEN